MALTISQAGSATSTTASTSLAITPTVSFSVGDGVIVLVAADNSTVSGGNPLATSTVTDSKSNTYSLVVTRQQQGASQNNLACVAGFFSVLTSSLTTSDTITLNLPNNTTAKAAVVWQIVAGAGQKPNVFASSGTSPTGDGTAISRSTGTIGAGKACVLAAAIENNGAVTADSDTTRGSWSSAHSAVADSGTALTSMQVVSQYKIATTSGTQNWDVTFSSSSYAAIYLNFDEVAAVNTLTRTATGSGTGTEYAMIPANPSADDVTDFVFGFANTPGFREFEEVPNYTYRKVVYFASPYKTTQGFYRGLKIVSVNATGSGNGTQTATRVRVKLRTATNSGSGTQTATRLAIRRRTATGSGTGTQTATAIELLRRTAIGSGSATASSIAVGVRVKVRNAIGSGEGTSSTTHISLRLYTANGSGIGSFTSTSILVAIRTATSSGTGIQTASFIRGLIRTANGSGTSTQSANAIEVLPRSATGSGQATTASVAVKLLIVIRTATGFGISAQTATFKRGLRRTASAPSAGTQTGIGARVARTSATGSGNGTSANTTFKNLVFRTPATTEIAPAERDDMTVSGRLFRYAEPTYAGVNVYKLTDGSYTSVEQRDYDLISKVYWGGTLNVVTVEEKADLVAAGYGDYVS